MGVPDVSALQRRVSPIHTVRGNRSSNSGLESVSQTCSLFPACPTLIPTLPSSASTDTLSCAIPSLLPWHGTLRLSLGCFQFPRRCVLPTSTFLRARPTLPILFLTIEATFTVLQLLRLNSSSMFILLLPLLPSFILLLVLPFVIDRKRTRKIKKHGGFSNQRN